MTSKISKYCEAHLPRRRWEIVQTDKELDVTVNELCTVSHSNHLAVLIIQSDNANDLV